MSEDGLRKWLEECFGTHGVDLLLKLKELFERFWRRNCDFYGELFTEFDKKIGDHFKWSLEAGENLGNPLSRKDLEEYLNLPRFAIPEIKMDKRIITPEDLRRERKWALFYITGFLSIDDEGNITLGVPYDPFDRGERIFAPSHIRFNIPNLFVATFPSDFLKRLYLLDVARRRGERINWEKIKMLFPKEKGYLVPPVIYEEMERLFGKNGHLGGSVAETSTEFYNRFKDFYVGSKKEGFKSVYVFSRTSGLFVMEEYEGSELKNPVRRIYFDAMKEGLSKGNVNVFYQVDACLTGQRLQKEGRIEESVKHLAQFLKFVNFELVLSKRPFDDPEAGTSWKNSYTLVSPIKVAISIRPENRKDEPRKIAHGYLILSELKEEIFENIEKIYLEEKRRQKEGIVKVVKRLGELLSPKEAEERAREAVEECLKLAKGVMSPD